MKVEAVIGAASAAVGYLVHDGEGEAMIVDAPLGSGQHYLKRVNELGLKVTLIVCTHGHWDQIGGVADLSAVLPEARLCAHSWDMARLANPSIGTEDPASTPERLRGTRADRWLSGGEVLAVSRFEFQVMHTPGHTPGSICLLEARAGVLFSGDLLLQHGVGRTDFAGGNPENLKKSLELLRALPDSTRVFPSHGRPTILGEERWLLELTQP